MKSLFRFIQSFDFFSSLYVLEEYSDIKPFGLFKQYVWLWLTLLCVWVASVFFMLGNEFDNTFYHIHDIPNFEIAGGQLKTDLPMPVVHRAYGIEGMPSVWLILADNQELAPELTAKLGSTDSYLLLSPAEWSYKSLLISKYNVSPQPLLGLNQLYGDPIYVNETNIHFWFKDLFWQLKILGVAVSVVVVTIGLVLGVLSLWVVCMLYNLLFQRKLHAGEALKLCFYVVTPVFVLTDTAGVLLIKVTSSMAYLNILYVLEWVGLIWLTCYMLSHSKPLEGANFKLSARRRH